MRILIDECLNWRLSRALTGHYAVSASKMGWSGLKNGALLSVAEQQFDVFITGDRNLTFQQNLAASRLTVVVLHARSTRLHDTLVLVPKILSVLSALAPGTVCHVYP